MRKLPPEVAIDFKRTATPTPTVGDVRQQTALQDAGEPVVLATQDPELRALVTSLRIVAVYPDTVTGDGEWKSCFKVEVVRR